MLWMLLLAGTLSAALPVAIVAAQPQLPATFFGAVTIDGKLPPPDSEVRALVDGLDCTQPRPGSGFVIEDGVGAYVVNVMHESQSPGCGREGATVTFTVNGRPAAQQAIWRPGPQEVNLNAGSGVPQQLPTPTPTPIPPPATPADPVRPSPADRPAGTPPTDDIRLTPAAPNETAQPAPTGTPPAALTPSPPQPADGDGISPPLVLGAIVGGLGAAGAVAGFALSRRKRQT